MCLCCDKYTDIIQLVEVSAHRGRTEDFSIQFPLAVNVILRDLHLETSRLSVKQLHAINWPNNLDVTCWWV